MSTTREQTVVCGACHRTLVIEDSGADVAMCMECGHMWRRAAAVASEQAREPNAERSHERVDGRREPPKIATTEMVAWQAWHCAQRLIRQLEAENRTREIEANNQRRANRVLLAELQEGIAAGAGAVVALLKTLPKPQAESPIGAMQRRDGHE